MKKVKKELSKVKTVKNTPLVPPLTRGDAAPKASRWERQGGYLMLLKRKSLGVLPETFNTTST